MCLSLFLFVFGLFLREQASRGGAEREGDRIPGRFRAVSTEPDVGLELTNREITT